MPIVAAGNAAVAVVARSMAGRTPHAGRAMSIRSPHDVHLVPVPIVALPRKCRHRVTVLTPRAHHDARHPRKSREGGRMIGGFILSAGAVECAQDQRDGRKSRPDRSRDGGAHGGVGRGAHDLRHGQSGRPRHGD